MHYNWAKFSRKELALVDKDRDRHSRALDFVTRLQWHDLMPDDPDVRRELKLKDNIKCADIVGFQPNRSMATHAIVCESKGTNIDDALQQIGNVAAALLDHFDSQNRRIQLFLLVYGNRIRQIPIGDSPGPNYLVGEVGEFGFRPLLDAGTDDRTQGPASAAIETKLLDARLTRWGTALSKVPVYYVLDHVPSP